MTQEEKKEQIEKAEKQLKPGEKVIFTTTDKRVVVYATAKATAYKVGAEIHALPHIAEQLVSDGFATEEKPKGK